jgi:UDP-N-acetylmuramate: L-alanyl-gamma-D-glutamyl-meso-diaminopimelate ligase
MFIVMHYHFIAIGGSIMHNLAISLQKLGHNITGSDDLIFEPSRSILKSCGLLPENQGWSEKHIHAGLDAVILGMHAKADNPELIKAIELGLPVFSFPEFVAQKSKGKTRIVVAGSHGKTTTASMIMHVLKESGRPFDYLVGARLEGFDTMVQLSDADIIVLEGDEYLSSAIDRRPKFLHYQPHIAVITGIAWDHMNVFPTYESYVSQFRDFLKSIHPGGEVYYFADDPELAQIVHNDGDHLQCFPYNMFPHETGTEGTHVIHEEENVEMPFYGRHNFQNMAAAVKVCQSLGIGIRDTIRALSSFRGASLRLETLVEAGNSIAIRDFAHAPSKLKATVDAVRERFPDKFLIACFELHTYSSLNKAFLPEYANTMAMADFGCVIYAPETLAVKQLPPVSPRDIRSAFNRDDLEIYTDPDLLAARLPELAQPGMVLLWMSSGRFGGLNIRAISISVFEAAG